MNRTTAILAASILATTLSACGSNNLFNRDRPDEFAVQRQMPLAVPPDFALNPPQPGAPRPANTNTQNQTLEALFGGQSPRSDVERNTTSRAGTPALRKYFWARMSAATWLNWAGTSMSARRNTIEPSGFLISLMALRNSISA